MSDEDRIKELAEKYELPVEQVALIWSVVDFMDGNYDIYFDGDISKVVEKVIRDKMV